ncbi:MAG: two-component system sensor histidine kinase NtrB, partial [bacterium]
MTTRAAAIGDVAPGAALERLAGIACDRLVGGELREQVSIGTPESTFIVAAHTTSDGRETVIVLNDITEERAQEAKAAHQDRLALIGQLAGGIAHDFNNLLSVMLSYASMVEDSVGDPTVREDIQKITRAATSASQLTRQLLMFSRREIVTPKVIDPAALVRELDRMMRGTLGTKVDLTTEATPDVPHVLIDGAQLEQIVVNLVVNARDAIAERGDVHLRLSRVQLATGSIAQLPPGGYVLLEVEDTGSGMPPEVQAHIFEPYFTTKGLHQGSGLGLATVHAIVSQAHGEIVVTSEVGKGTTFRIYLPETDRPLDVE